MKRGFIGAGEMGGAIIRGLLKTGWKAQDILASVRTPEKANLLASTLGMLRKGTAFKQSAPYQLLRADIERLTLPNDIH